MKSNYQHFCAGIAQDLMMQIEVAPNPTTDKFTYDRSSEVRLQGSETISFGGGIAHISFSGEGRIHLGNNYIFVSMHHYCGPEFYYDKNMTKPYKFTENSEDDPIWPLFKIWHKKYMAEAKKAGKYWATE